MLGAGPAPGGDGNSAGARGGDGGYGGAGAFPSGAPGESTGDAGGGGGGVGRIRINATGLPISLGTVSPASSIGPLRSVPLPGS